jgi:hypothetical protein
MIKVNHVVLSCLICLIFIVGCEVNRSNDQDDKNDAQIIAVEFYTKILSGERKELLPKCGVSMSPDDAERTFSILDSIAGKLTDYEISSIETDVRIAKGVKTGVYDVQVSCIYEKVETTELLQIVVNDTGYVYGGYVATIDVK